MGDRSSIEWTDATWNPVTGCTKVSQGCKHCYAERVFPRPYPGRAFTDVRVHEDRLDQPLRWAKPRRIFANSMSDLFHEDVPEAFIWSVLVVVSNCPRHTFQVLTKRPARMRKVMATFTDFCHRPGPLPNLWLGVSVEDQATADERIPLLLRTPASVRFVSCEPLLGPVDLRWAFPDIRTACCHRCGFRTNRVGGTCPNDGETLRGDVGIDWVIVGGESGPLARPMHPDWVRSLRDQCAGAQVPFFFKQWGEWTPGENVTRRHGKVWTATWIGSNWLAMPEWLSQEGGHRDDEPTVYRVGKRAAGRLLDGDTWDQFPQ